MSRTPRSPRGFHIAAISLAAVAALAASACGDDSSEPAFSTAAQRGRDLARDRGCVNCHTSNGSASTGPTWQGLWGSEETLEDGRAAVVDRDYVARAVREPQADVVEGFGAVMPTFDLSDAELDDLVAYLEALVSDDNSEMNQEG